MLVLVGSALGFAEKMWLADGGTGGQSTAVDTASRQSATAAKAPVPPLAGGGSALEEDVLASAPAEPPAPSTASASSGEVTADSPSGAYTLQVGAFLDAAQAGQLAKAVSATGRSPIVVHTVDSEGRVWQSVRIGDYPDAPTASVAAGALLRYDEMPATVVLSR
jgi:cell division protein FtsN